MPVSYYDPEVQQQGSQPEASGNPPAPVLLGIGLLGVLGLSLLVISSSGYSYFAAVTTQASNAAIATKPNTRLPPHAAPRAIQPIKPSKQNVPVDVPRRTAILGAAAAMATLANPKPADAFLGIGGNPRQKYEEKTTHMIQTMQELISLERGDERMADVYQAYKQESNTYVADYRRNDKFSGTQSFGLMYTSVNILSGHFASFGSTTPLTKKRRALLESELDKAAKNLAKGR